MAPRIAISSNDYLAWAIRWISFAALSSYKQKPALNAFRLIVMKKALCLAPLLGTYIDVSPPSGAKIYQVRTVVLTVTGSGSFTNLSQAAFCSAS